MSGSLFSSSLMDQAAREMEFLDRYQIKALFLNDPEYPRRLKECKDAPIILYTRGEKGLNTKRALSVVGTRRASSYGKEICRNMVLELAASIEDLVIISGLAYGIDVIAHRAALDAGIPTMAVLGHGLGTIYPHAHRETAKKIIEHGALLTDFHSGMGPERNNFLRRNRIIAGTGDATLVVESAAEGGALITANLASSYNRDVLAVPGRATDERSRGCNRLIKAKLAALVEGAVDVIRELNWTNQNSFRAEVPREIRELTSTEKQVMELFSKHQLLSPEELGELSGIPIHEVLSLITALEIKGCISREPGNRYQSILAIC
jgi:DNA processing protein